jgi:serine/threonine protein kinase
MIHGSDYKNLPFTAQPQSPLGARALETVHALTHEAMGQLKRAQSHGPGANPTEVKAQADAVQAVGARLVASLQALEKSSERPSLQGSLGLTQALSPLLHAWTQQVPSLSDPWRPAIATMSQLRAVASQQETRLFEGLKAALERTPEGTLERQQLLQGLATLGASAITDSIRRKIEGLGLAANMPQSDLLSPLAMLGAAPRGVTPQAGQAAAESALRAGVGAGGQSGAHLGAALQRRPRVPRRPTAQPNPQPEAAAARGDGLAARPLPTLPTGPAADARPARPLPAIPTGPTADARPARPLPLAPGGLVANARPPKPLPALPGARAADAPLVKQLQALHLRSTQQGTARASGRPGASPSAKVGPTAAVAAVGRQEPTTKSRRIVANFHRIQGGFKTRVSLHTFQHSDSSRGRYSLLTSSTGQSWVMTPTLASGSFGKVRYALAEDDSQVAVKEMRLRLKEGVNRSGHSKTQASHPDEIVQEAKLTMRLRSGIERSMARFDAPDSTSTDSLQGSRTGTKPFQIYDIVSVPEQNRPSNDLQFSKVHMVMTKDVGSLWDLEKSLTTEALKKQASLSLAAQGFTELDILHTQERHSHLDISPGNIFFNEQGQMRIMDFGMAEPTNPAGIARSTGLIGTFFTPEMIEMLPASGQPMRPHSTAQDVFALGICVAQLAAGPNVKNPFFFGGLPGPSGSQDELIGAYALVADYRNWRDSCRGPDGTIRADLVRNEPNDPSDPRGFGPFFSSLATANPELFEILAHQALEENPARRAPARQIAELARGKLPPANSRATKGLIRAMAEVEESKNVPKIMEEAAVFRDWEVQTRAARNAPRFGRGEARPLPR